MVMFGAAGLAVGAPGATQAWAYGPAVALMLGMALQNIPEGLAVALPLQALLFVNASGGAPDDIVLDSSNFIEGSKSGGMFGAGSAASPLDVNRAVQSATAAALRAVQVVNQVARAEA